MGAIDNDWLDARIAKTKALIEALENAIDALVTSPKPYVTYTLRTGQSEEVVTRTDLGRLQAALAAQEARLAALDARRNGGASRIARPAF